MSVEFSIKDLENICGIKAHTIRMWEKRYLLLTPNRTDTNIRTYDMENLKKLLNVSFLVNCGYKISRIAKLNDSELEEYLTSVVSDQTVVDKTFNSLKLSMLNFNATIFNNAFNEASERFSFNEIFNNIWVPFLNEIGMLWQSGTINSTHEHFITQLIKQKISCNIEHLQNTAPTKDKTFVLFLPSGESSDLALLFLHNLLLDYGFKTVYLGANVSTANLLDISKIEKNIVFLSYFTVSPNKENVLEYVTNFKEQICLNNDHEFWMMGRITKETPIPIDMSTKVINSFEDFEKLIN